MKRLGTIILVITALAGRMHAQEAAKHALGFAGGLTGGYGLSYKHFFTPKDAVQLTGFAFGDSESGLNYNIGALYHRVLHQAEITRLILATGCSWMHGIDPNGETTINTAPRYDGTPAESLYYYVDDDPNDYWSFNTGVTIGIELRAFQLGFGLFGGYRLSINEGYEDRYEYTSRDAALNRNLQLVYGVGFTGDVALYYYF